MQSITNWTYEEGQLYMFFLCQTCRIRVSDPDPDPQALDVDPLPENLSKSDGIRIHNYFSNSI